MRHHSFGKENYSGPTLFDSELDEHWRIIHKNRGEAALATFKTALKRVQSLIKKTRLGFENVPTVRRAIDALEDRRNRAEFLDYSPAREQADEAISILRGELARAIDEGAQKRVEERNAEIANLTREKQARWNELPGYQKDLELKRRGLL